MRLSALLLCLSLPALCGAAESVAHFEKHIRPLFLEHCQSCHGAEKQKGGLRLDSAAGWQTGGDSGPALVAGDAAASLMMKALSHTDRDLKMPPKGKLPDATIQAVAEWIQMGAPDPRSSSEPAGKGSPKAVAPTSQHWAFQLPKAVAPPAVKNAGWPRTDLDHFVLAKLEERGLTPAPDADAQTLQRRLSYDLTGLPPASEKQGVDALLHSTGWMRPVLQNPLAAAGRCPSRMPGATATT
jgi:hypothetical protein